MSAGALRLRGRTALSIASFKMRPPCQKSAVPVPRGSERRRIVSPWVPPSSKVAMTESGCPVGAICIAWHLPPSPDTQKTRYGRLRGSARTQPRGEGWQPGHLLDVDARAGEAAVSVAVSTHREFPMGQTGTRFAGADLAGLTFGTR